MASTFQAFWLLQKDCCLLLITHPSLHLLRRLFGFRTVGLDIPHFICSSIYFLLYYPVVLFRYFSVNLVNLSKIIVFIFLSVIIKQMFLFQLCILIFGVLLELSILLGITGLSRLLMIFSLTSWIYLLKEKGEVCHVFKNFHKMIHT